MNEDSEIENVHLLVRLEDYEGNPVDFLSNAKSYSIVGLDTETPYLQIDDKVFVGSFETSAQDNILFEKSSSEENSSSSSPSSASNPLVSSTEHLKYSCHTNLVLKFRRVRLHPKTTFSNSES